MSLLDWLRSLISSVIPTFGNIYLQSLLILVVAVIAAQLFIVLFRFLVRLAARTKTKADDLIFDHTRKPIFYLILAYGLKLALQNLRINGIAQNVVESAMALVFLFIIIRVIDLALEVWGTSLAKKTKTMFDDVVLPLFHKATKAIFIIIGFMWVLQIWRIDITPYLAGVGISGIVLGLALQDSLKNVFGGISLILDKNFNIGDAVKLESGEMGVIKEIGLRSTKMLTYDNEIIFIPNGQLATMKIHNFVRPNSRVRKIVDFSVEYGTEPEKVEKVVMQALREIKDIYDEPYMDVIFVSMGDSGLHFKARFWADWDLAYNKWVEATGAIYGALNKAGIGIPFPTRTIYLKDRKK